MVNVGQRIRQLRPSRLIDRRRHPRIALRPAALRRAAALTYWALHDLRIRAELESRNSPFGAHE
jgi:hypothetical protein